MFYTCVLYIENEQHLDVEGPDNSISIKLQKKHPDRWGVTVFQSKPFAVSLDSGFPMTVARRFGTHPVAMACDNACDNACDDDGFRWHLGTTFILLYRSTLAQADCLD